MTPQSVARVSQDPRRHDVTFSFVIFAILGDDAESESVEVVVRIDVSET